MIVADRGVAAVVPAAGASLRFGGAKLVADVSGEPLLQHTLRSLLEAGVSRVVVVTAAGQNLASVDLARDPRISIAVNPDPDRGMFSSVQTGLAAVDPDWSVVVLPADMPFVRAQTIAALVDTHRRDGGAVVARHAGKRGHPVIVPAGARAALLDQPSTISLKDALARAGVILREVAFDDPGVLRDVDVREDLPPAVPALRERQ